MGDESDEEARPENPSTIDQLIDHMRKIGKRGICREYEEIRSIPPVGLFETSR